MLWVLGWESLAPSTGAGLVTAVATLMTAGGVLIGGVAVLLPNLKRLTERVETVHTAVTENHHHTPGAPTIPDRIEDVALDVKALIRVVDEHLKWSNEYTARNDRELAELREERENG
jgi:hypothetical protein